MAYLHLADFVDLWYKLKERGAAYAATKFISSPEKRIQSTWNEDELPGSNWWQVDAVRQRWNELITGDKYTIYPDYVVRKYLHQTQEIKLLSVGCGTGQRELEFAKHTCFSHIDAFDIAPKAIADAQQSARELGLNNCHFFVGDVYDSTWNQGTYDVVLFHSSLHHFTDLPKLIHQVKKVLKPNGLLVINEYVGANRFQFSNLRKKVVQKTYQSLVPSQFKTRKNSKVVKSSVYFPGKLRMILSDPSEAIESASILPLLNQHFSCLEQKNYGGNLLTFILKDIAHHFNTPEAQPILEKLFDAEDELIKKEQCSDFVVAVYTHNKPQSDHSK